MRKLPFYLCAECGPTGSREECIFRGHHVESCTLQNAIGLIGARATGKTVYLATLHDQLMHGAPEWGVSVSDYAFSKLTRDYRSMCSRERPESTQRTVHPFVISARWKSQKVEMLASDAAGEFYQRSFAEIPSPLSDLLLCSRVILVTVGLFWSRDQSHSFHDPNDEDEELGVVFRQLLTHRTSLRHVVVLLTGVDRWGDEPIVATESALQDFAATYRVFTGVLKNGGIRLDVVPLSNFGFANVDGFDLLGPPRPYNIFEPLRLALPNYAPFWRRMFMRTATGQAETAREPRPIATDSGRVAELSGSSFLSYRRDGGAETARLIRHELVSRGRTTFLDVEDLPAGYFDDRLLLEIQNAPNFIVILSPGCFATRTNDDWLVREIRHALVTNRRIVPVILDGFTFPSPDTLPEGLSELARINAVHYSHSYFKASIDKLVSFLERDATGHASAEKRQITKR